MAARTALPAAFDPSKEVDDPGVGRIIAHGAEIGIPIAYAVCVLMALPGAGLAMALAIAVVPAVFAGPWMGTTIVLLYRALVADARAATVTELPAPMAPHQGSARQAA